MLNSLETALGAQDLGGACWTLPAHTKAPAATLRHFGEIARQEAGEMASATRCSTNASRDAQRFVGRWGLAWRVPISNLKYGNNTALPWISPTDFVTFLLSKAPELLMGGLKGEAGQNNLEPYWDAYEQSHPSHVLFTRRDNPERTKRNTLCMSLFGDEGRGLKKGNTCVISLETNLGLFSNKKRTREFASCLGCEVEPAVSKRICANGRAPVSAPSDALQRRQCINLRHHSLLTKYAVAALPNSIYKNTQAVPKLLEAIAAQLEKLFEVGVNVNGQRWFIGFTGCKGDLDWHLKTFGLTRCWKQQTTEVAAHCCHECLAGSGAADFPFEDASFTPGWGPTVFSLRPWGAQEPALLRIPHEAGSQKERIIRRDFFHNTKCGLLRDFAGSSILLLARLGYFNEQGPGVSNARDVLLERAFNHFRLFCKGIGKTPAVHYFCPMYFNAKKQSCFGWTNSKGADTTLLVAWVRVFSRSCLFQPISNEHVHTLELMNRAAQYVDSFQNTMYSQGLWFDRSCATRWCSDVHSFLAAYNKLAFLALRKWCFTAYAIKPKFHLVAHSKQEVFQLLQNPRVQWVPNPLQFACEMNEDVVGRLSLLSRRVHASTCGTMTLRLYLIKCRAVHKRFASLQEN